MNYLFPSLEALRYLFVGQVLVNRMLVELVIVVVFLDATLVRVEKVERDNVDVEQKETDQDPR